MKKQFSIALCAMLLYTLLSCKKDNNPQHDKSLPIAKNGPVPAFVTTRPDSMRYTQPMKFVYDAKDSNLVKQLMKQHPEGITDFKAIASAKTYVEKKKSTISAQGFGYYDLSQPIPESQVNLDGQDNASSYASGGDFDYYIGNHDYELNDGTDPHWFYNSGMNEDLSSYLDWPSDQGWSELSYAPPKIFGFNLYDDGMLYNYSSALLFPGQNAFGAFYPYLSYKYLQEYSAPVFRTGLIIDVCPFTMRNTAMTIYIPYRYAAQLSKYTSEFKFTFGYVQDLVEKNPKSLFSVTGSHLGELDYSQCAGNVDMGYDRTLSFVGYGLREKRTIITTTKNKAIFSASANVEAFKIGTEISGEGTIKAASNCYNDYYTQGNATFEAKGWSDRPHYQVNWTAYCTGPQKE